MDDDRGVSDDVSTSPESARPGRRIRRVGVIAVIASFIGIWGYVMYLSIFVGRAEPRDRLSDRAYAESAETVCAPFRADIDTLPFANELKTPAERADVLDEATSQLEVMVEELETLTPPTEADEALAVQRWLADWVEYNGNRRSYADRFRAGLDEPFRVTDRDGEQIDTKIDDFAHLNFMESCETPNDVG